MVEICFVKLILDVFREITMKLLVTPLSEIASEIACEVAVKYCSIVLKGKTNLAGISLAISLAISLGVYWQLHGKFH